MMVPCMHAAIMPCFRTMVALTLDDVSCLATMMCDGCMYLASWLHAPCIMGECTLHRDPSLVKVLSQLLSQPGCAPHKVRLTGSHHRQSAAW
jgi:hypothetical protein